MPAQTRETMLFSFRYATGEYPDAGLTDVNGVLYGAAEFAGANSEGTVFKITTSGGETELHNFGASSGGANPYATLINVHGVLYGTTAHGGVPAGNYGLGTVFKITTSGAESVLYNFGGGSDGELPYAGLTEVNGALYGTTSGGGAKGGYGTVFKITPSGVESVLYSFAGGSDGAFPEASLTDVNGVLYGTTTAGGNGECLDHTGCGTVFEVTTSGTEAVLHRFAGGNDGTVPLAGLTDVNGVLYGTTYGGGVHGAGTVFTITPSGTESVFYSFAGGSSDGAHPYASLTNVNGVLYGTTRNGGIPGGQNGTNGTVFSITTSGTESVLYRFTGGRIDGAYPYAGLTTVNSVLYGTTSEGGAYDKGTVFSFSLSNGA